MAEQGNRYIQRIEELAADVRRLTGTVEVLTEQRNRFYAERGDARADRDRLVEDLARAEAEHAAAMERLFRDMAMRRREHHATRRRAEQAEAVLAELDVTDDQLHDITRRIAARRRGVEQSRRMHITTSRDGDTR